MSETVVVEAAVNSEVKVIPKEAGDLVSSIKLSTDQKDKLSKLIKLIPDILSALDNKEYDEIYGYRINIDTAEYVNVIVRNEILLKFLIANEYNVSTTKDKLIEALNWRNKFQPLSAAFKEDYDSQLDKLGAITNFPGNKDNLQVTTWNLYGNLDSPKEFFAKVCHEGNGSKNPGSSFLRWRVGLMERSLQLLDFTSPDNNKIVQIHDYNNVSMLRMDPSIKAATKEIIAVFGDNYPELLSIKFFVNVPSLMSWVFSFFRKLNIISADTMKKFQVLNNCNLTEWLGKDNLPKTYNGGYDTGISSVFDLEKAISTDIKLTTYGQRILESTTKTKIEEATLSVD